MIKMFASDLDGTLLNGLHETDRTIGSSAVEEALSQGAHFVYPPPAVPCCRSATGGSPGPGRSTPWRQWRSSVRRSELARFSRPSPVDPALRGRARSGISGNLLDCCTPDGMFSSGSYEMHQEGFRRDNLFRRIVMRQACAHVEGRMRSSFSTSRSARRSP